MVRSEKFRGVVGKCAMVAALAGLGVGVLGMGPRDGRDWHGRDGRGRQGDHGGWGWPVVVVRPPVIVVRPPVFERCVEEAPCNVRIEAYQSQDRVIVLISGANEGEGFCTAVTGVDWCEGQPVLVVRNTAPECRRGCATPFSMNASVGARCALSSIRVRIAGHVYEAPVVAVASVG